MEIVEEIKKAINLTKQTIADTRLSSTEDNCISYEEQVGALRGYAEELKGGK